MRNSSRAWHVLKSCLPSPGHLRVLTLRNVIFEFDNWNDGQRELLSGLEALTLHNCSIRFRDRDPESSAALDFFGGDGGEPAHVSLEQPGMYWKALLGVKIQRLSMTDSNVSLKEQYQLLRDCRELRSLQWAKQLGDVQEDGKPALAKGFREGWWPFLERLELMMHQFSDEGLTEILAAIPRPLKTLRMDKTSFGEGCARALLESGEGRHCKSLESLSLVGCAYLQGSMVQRFLCEMPRLRTLHARVLTDQDIARDPRPWVCQDLRDLQVGFVRRLFFKNNAGFPVEVASEDPLSVSVVFDRLSNLSNLHTLGFMDSEPVGDYIWNQEKLTARQEYHRLLIDNGLDVLKSLTGMRFLKFGETDQDLTLEEAQWMVEHWPRLCAVAVSRASANMERTIQLRTFFNSHSVNCR